MRDTALLEKTGIKQLLAAAVQAGASDLHINVGMPPVLRINTELVLMKSEPVSSEQAAGMLTVGRCAGRHFSPTMPAP